jgi:glycosyltransferase involved in cell wall biosynthesis
MPALTSAFAISVIIPCRNAADVIEVQLRALAAQRCGRPWEVIVVDNGSIDGTKAVVERWRDRLPRLVTVDALTRRGAAYARNTGVAAALGENVAFCDADDEVAPGWLEALDTALRQHEAVAFRMEAQKLNGTAAIGRKLGQTDGLQSYTYPPYLPYSGATLAVRRHIFLALGGFDETMLACEDADFCWRLQHAGYALHFASDAVVHVRLRETLRDMCRQARIWGEWNVVLYKKYRPLGMPKLRRTPGVKNLVGIIRRTPLAINSTTRAQWLWQANWAAGRLIGSIKHRVWAL